MAAVACLLASTPQQLSVVLLPNRSGAASNTPTQTECVTDPFVGEPRTAGCTGKGALQRNTHTVTQHNTLNAWIDGCDVPVPACGAGR